MKYTALIPVRAGSRRLPNKNVQPFGDSNLLIHKIRQLKKVEGIGEIVVSSDSDIMLEMARAEGVSAHKRPIEYADEKTKTWGEMVAYCAEHVCRGENVILACCVTPLCGEENFEAALRTYEEEVLGTKRYDSLASVKAFKEYLWDGKEPLNYKPGMGHVTSQQLPEWRVLVNGFFIAPRWDMVRWTYHLGSRPYLFVIPKNEAVDIDDAEDFAVAKALYEYRLGKLEQ